MYEAEDTYRLWRNDRKYSISRSWKRSGIANFSAFLSSPFPSFFLFFYQRTLDFRSDYLPFQRGKEFVYG